MCACACVCAHVVGVEQVRARALEGKRTPALACPRVRLAPAKRTQKLPFTSLAPSLGAPLAHLPAVAGAAPGRRRRRCPGARLGAAPAAAWLPLMLRLLLGLLGRALALALATRLLGRLRGRLQAVHGERDRDRGRNGRCRGALGRAEGHADGVAARAERGRTRGALPRRALAAAAAAAAQAGLSREVRGTAGRAQQGRSAALRRGRCCGRAGGGGGRGARARGGRDAAGGRAARRLRGRRLQARGRLGLRRGQPGAPRAGHARVRAGCCAGAGAGGGGGSAALAPQILPQDCVQLRAAAGHLRGPRPPAGRLAAPGAGHPLVAFAPRAGAAAGLQLAQPALDCGEQPGPAFGPTHGVLRTGACVWACVWAWGRGGRVEWGAEGGGGGARGGQRGWRAGGDGAGVATAAIRRTVTYTAPGRRPPPAWAPETLQPSSPTPRAPRSSSLCS
jgi:hypothetical protein